MDTLGSRAVGSTITLEVGGSAASFLIVHQGNPDPALYDASCDGTWLMMDDVAVYDRLMGDFDFPNSGPGIWLNEDFFDTLSADVQALVKQIRLPYYYNGLRTGADGALCKIFMPTPIELGGADDVAGRPVDSAVLAYFADCGGDGAAAARIANYQGHTESYWTRTPNTTGTNQGWYVTKTGAIASQPNGTNDGLRPMMILPDSTLIAADGSLSPNTAPAITSTAGASGVDLGGKSAPFSLPYIVTDPDGGTLTVTEQVDGVTTRSHSPASGALCGFEAVSDSTQFSTLGIGPHTLTIQAGDGADTSVWTATFTKAATSASLTLASPILTEGQILSAVIQVEGSIPADADYSVEITNNALDTAPVWQDATEASRDGSRVTFLNQTAAAGWAFNYRIEAARGASGTGGYISAVSGTIRSAVED